MIKFTGDLRRDFERATEEIQTQKDRILGYQEKIRGQNATIKNLRKTNAAQKERLEGIIAEKEAVIKELENQLAHELALKNHDSSNTGTPTSQTSPGKKKRIPNSREKSSRKKGGQQGHERHEMDIPSKEEINDVVVHEIPENSNCPGCGSDNIRFTGKTEVKYEVDYEVTVKKIRHEFNIYECLRCGKKFRSKIPPGLWAKCQYGSEVQAQALSMINTVNSPINKVKTFISGITGGQIVPSEGYIAKLQRRASSGLDEFMEDLRRELIQRPLVYWDETVVMMMTKRGCLRFYGDERLAFYAAHLHKDMASLDDDNVLNLLTSETKTMHDHNRVNYNEKYSFENLECIQHLQRDLQKSADDTGHGELLELKTLITDMIWKRKQLIEAGNESLSKKEIDTFERKLERILSRAEKKNEKDFNKYSGPFERTLIKRIREYRTNYFAWIYDFTLPTTNNLSERALRCVKSHMKISGQFESEKTAGFFARIKSYIETCRRNNINEIHALKRLVKGNPFTVAEILSQSC